MDKNNIYKSDENQIEFFELIKIVYNQKIIIIGIALITFVISFITFSNKPNSFSGLIEIRAFSPIFNVKFNNINEIIFSQKETKEINRFDVTARKKFFYKQEKQEIGSRYFHSLFLEEIYNKNILQNIIKEKTKSLQNFNGSEEELSEISWKLANDFRIVDNNINKNKDLDSFTIYFKTTDKKETEEILKAVFSKISKVVVNKTLLMLDTLKTNDRLRTKNLKIKIQKQIELSNNLDKYLIEKNIEFIKRHLVVANKLNINQNLFVKKYPNTFIQFKDFTNDLFLELNYFYKGTEVLSQELSLLKRKIEKKEGFKNLKSIELINKLKNSIKRDFNLRLETAILQSPLSDKNVNVINFEINNIKYKKTSNYMRLTIIYTIISLFISIILVLIINSYKQHRKL